MKPSVAPLAIETDAYGSERLTYQPDGWNFWDWRGRRVHYIAAGESGPPLVLVHGFGASAYHWRYNIPELAKSHRVYAVDMLGFGNSDKPVIDYYSNGSNVWAEQLGDFVREVVWCGQPSGERVVLAGNSLGGYNSLSAAAQYPELVRGLVLLNGAGRFEDVPPEGAPATPAADAAAAAAEEAGVTAALKEWLSGAARSVGEVVKRGVLYVTFMQTKQPARVRQVLNSVYVSDRNVDDVLVQSILDPSNDPNAAAVFAKVITGQGETVNKLLQKLDGLPVLLLWGDQDPWITPSKAALIQQLYPAATKVGLPSGHCPHDDTPELVNEELAQWVAQLD